MNLEYCVMCECETGIAGELDDSLFLNGEPHCESCYADALHYIGMNKEV